jgi:3',5'-cyclic AMP phosphodiesterase CpdA
VVDAELRRWSGPFTFVQLADTQFGLATSMAGAIAAGKLDMSMTAGLRADVQRAIGAAKAKQPAGDSGAGDRSGGSGGGDRQQSSSVDYDQVLSFLYDRELDFSRRTVAAINAMVPPPRFVVVCGDLVNQYPKTQDGPLGQRQQVADFRRIFSHVRDDIRLLCLCGNHDVGDRPNSASIARFTERFGDDYFTFLFGGVQFVALNSQLYKDATDAPAEAAAQDAWLRGVTGELQRRRQEQRERGSRPRPDDASMTALPRHVVAFSHIPPFIESQDEPSAYFNLEQSVRTRLLGDLSEAGCTAWFCGHYHRNARGVYTHPEGSSHAGGKSDKNSSAGNSKSGGHLLEVVVSSAVGTTLTTSTDDADDPLGLSGMGTVQLGASTSGLRVVRVGEDGITHEWTTLEDIESRRGAERTR